jgi:endonuclease/exonuclease/phosphatase family metal-dependent hydrolase
MKHGKLDKDTAKGIKELRKRIRKTKIPTSRLDESINIATWNIREFGRKKRRRASLHYIAEIFNQFDLIAITELRRNLSQLKMVMDILGPYWKVVFSDYINDRGGNWERVAYLYDKRAVVPTGLVAEADFPRKKNKKTGEYESPYSWWRKPYIASFRAGSFDFILIAVHIRWGNGKEVRIKPLRLLADWIDKRRNDKLSVDKDIILMGDFNIPKTGDPLYGAITSKGLKAPKAIFGLKQGSNLAKKMKYDQIFHSPGIAKSFTNRAGVLDFYTGGIKKLYPTDTPTKDDFTYELSDHLPLWIQMDIDTEDEELDQIIKSK